MKYNKKNQLVYNKDELTLKEVEALEAEMRLKKLAKEYGIETKSKRKGGGGDKMNRDDIIAAVKSNPIFTSDIKKELKKMLDNDENFFVIKGWYNGVLWSAEKAEMYSALEDKQDVLAKLKSMIEEEKAFSKLSADDKKTTNLPKTTKAKIRKFYNKNK